MKSAPPVFPFNFRWRLAIAFLVVASIAAGVVALGAYVLVRRDRFESFDDRATNTANLAVAIIENAFASNPDVDVAELVRRLETQGSFQTVIRKEGTVGSSSPGFDLGDVSVIEGTTPDQDGHKRLDTQVDGRRGALIKPREDVEEADAYLFFSSEGLRRQLAELASTLRRAWFLVTILAGGLGFVLARRTLRPVARASEAARSLAEGLLETRLPVEREDEFGAWAVSFNEMADELQKKIEALTEARDREVRFTSDVAHELKTPLTALVASAELLRPHVENLDSDARWAAQHLLNEVLRVRALVEELLEISRLDAHQETVATTQIRIDTFLSALLRRRGWADAVRLDGEPCSIETDPRRLERVVANLIENALVHGRQPVAVETSASDGHLQLAVLDAGDGVPEGDEDKVFERFYKADPSRAGGSGLGLAIARENALLLGGDITVVREAGRTTFQVELPAN